MAVYFAASHATRQNDRVKHAVLVQLSIERLLPELNAAAADYDSIPHKLAQLGTLTSGNPQQIRSLTELNPVGLERLRFNRETVDLRLSRGLDPKDAISRIHHTGNLLTTTALALNDMRNEERRLLPQREQDFSTAQRSLAFVLIAGFPLGVFVTGSLYWRATRYRHQGADAQHRLSTFNATLEQRVEERTSRLQADQALLQLFVRHVPAAAAMFDREMRYLNVSDRFCSDFNLNPAEIIGKSHYDVFPELPERWKAIHQSCLAGENLRSEEDTWHRPGLNPMWLRWELRPWGDQDGLPAGIIIFSEDITARKNIAQDLLEREATNRALLETASQAIIAVDAESRIVLANRMVEQMFGHDHNQLLGQPLETLLPPAVRDRHKLHQANFAVNPQPRPMGIGIELRGLRKDGSEFPIEINLSSVITQSGPLSVGFITDITQRKHSETALHQSELELRTLAGNLLTAFEDERRRIARDLHDDVTQTLASLSIEIGKLASNTRSAPENTSSRLVDLQKQVVQITTEIRSLSHGLHPSIIEDLGLQVALEDLCDEFAKTQEVTVIFEGELEDRILDRHIASCLYRVAQESLRNAAKHAQATRIRVALTTDGGNIHLAVNDNGIGFSSAGNTHLGLGIISMKERLRLVNGMISIVSRIDQGTEILATVPLGKGEHEKTSSTLG